MGIEAAIMEQIAMASLVATGQATAELTPIGAAGITAAATAGGAMLAKGQRPKIPIISRPRQTTEQTEDFAAAIKKRLEALGGKESTILTAGWLKPPGVGKTRLGEYGK